MQVVIQKSFFKVGLDNVLLKLPHKGNPSLVNYKELSEESCLVPQHLIGIFSLSHHTTLVLPLRILLSLGEVLVWLLNPVWVDFQAGWTAESLAAQNAGQDCGGVEQAWGGAAPPDEVSAVLCRFPEQPTPSQAWGAV